MLYDWFNLLTSLFCCLFFSSSLATWQAQKAKDKEENEQLIDELDKNFTSLVQSKALLSLTQPNKMNALKALVNKSISNEFVKKDVVFAPQNEDTLQQV